MSIVLIDASEDSLTVSWPDYNDAAKKSKQKPSNSSATTTTTTTYHLQYQRFDSTATSTSSKDDATNNKYETLSNSLHTTLVRKKNLTDPTHCGFMFRVCHTTHNNASTTTTTVNAAVDSSHSDAPNEYCQWITHTTPFFLLSNEQLSVRMTFPPTVTYGGTNASLRISWTAYNTTNNNNNNNNNNSTEEEPSSYEIQMRENIGGEPWITISAMYKSIEVRKKNCTSRYGYQFRIRPVLPTTIATSEVVAAAGNENTIQQQQQPFSPPSEPFVALSYDTNCIGLQRLFASVTNHMLLSNVHPTKTKISSSSSSSSGTTMHVPVTEALGGKEFILLYASAHWCGPCRQYTPKLITWYQQQLRAATATATAAGNGEKSGRNHSSIEIVFLSADHDQRSFQSYYSSMPWTAIDFDDTTREQLMSHIRVTGIPRLAVLDGRTGRIIEENAVQKPFDIQRWRKLVSK